MDAALTQIVDGSWDSSAARAQFIADADAERFVEEYMPKLNAAMIARDFKTAVKLCDEILAKLPEHKLVKQIRMSFLLQGNQMEEFNKAAAAQVEEYFDSPRALNQVARLILKTVGQYVHEVQLAFVVSL
ncbi:hypothetical protein [Novipirellula herctigrandis]|uniref:hypothetical protein n=1 Tax=Novipirellula herctigrandis TaxID=2527986 RepID=UPI003AF3D5E8